MVYRMGARGPRGLMTAGKGGFLLNASAPYDAALTTGKARWSAVRVRGTRMDGFGDSGGFGCSGQSIADGTGFLDPAAATGTACGVRMVRCGVRNHPYPEYGWALPDWALFPTERPDQLSVARKAGRFKAGQPLYKAGTNEYYLAEDAGFPLVAAMNALLADGTPVTIPANTQARLVWDLGDYWCAYPHLEVSGGKGAEVRWGWAESLYDRSHRKSDRGAFAGKRCAHALRDTFRPDGRATAHFTSPWWRSGRWCEFEVKTADEPLTLKDLSFTEVRYPLDIRASFTCDDESIADIWRICRRGLECCLGETYMDCPYFEQLMYPGDMRIEQLLVDALKGDARLARFGIGMFDYARGEDGRVPMSFQRGQGQTSSTLSMNWVTMLGDYVTWHGADRWLKARLPGMRHTLHSFVDQLDSDGLLANPPGWNVIDWAQGWEYGNPPGVRTEPSAVVNLLLAHALDSAAHTEDAAGDSAMAAYWLAKKDALSGAIMAKFWHEGRGLLADTVAKDRFSEHAQCLAILSGVLPPDLEARAADGLCNSTDLTRTAPYFSHYLFSAYFKHGRVDLFLKRLDMWRGYARKDLCAPHEGIERSDCHAFAAHPIYHLLTGVAGIQPATNGFAAVRIAPQPGGLRRVAADMPTPKGIVSLDLHFDSNLPVGTVKLPDGLPGTFVWSGEPVPLHAGTNLIGK